MNTRTAVMRTVDFLDSITGRRVLMLLIAVTVGWGYFKVITPTRADRQRLISDAAKLTQTTQATRTELETLKQELARNGGTDLSGELLRALPGAVRTDRQLEVLSALAEHVNVKLRSWEPGTPTSAGEVQKLPVNLTLSGGFSNCLRFLGGLHNLTRRTGQTLRSQGPIWYVDQISVSPGSGRQVTLTLTAGLYLAAGGQASSTPPNPTQPTTTTP